MLNPETPANEAGVAGGSSLWLRVSVGLVVLLLLGGALAVWLWPDRAPPAGGDADEEFDRLLAVVNPGYVGIETCAECHTQRAADVKTTRHYLACRPAADGVAAPGFSAGRGRFDTRLPGLRFEMTREGDDYFATSIQATAGGERRVCYQIGLVYGSANKRDEMYFAWQDDRLLHVPVAWLYPFERWGDASDNNLRVLDTSPSCLECHNTWMAHLPGTAGRYRRDDMLLGVTCERCHGPGREHVEYHRAHPKDEAHAILHPGTLSRDRLMDVCAQCHGNTRLVGRPFSYRPGQPLEPGHRTAPRARYREDDTTTNQVQYLGESKCFQKSTMTCITCHDPHWPGSARSGCLKCHVAASCTDGPHQPAAVRGDCVGCHMPQQIWMNSHYYTTSDDRYLPVAPRSEHRIAVYPEAKQAVELAWLRQQPEASRAEADRLAARLTEHWLNEAERRRGDGRLMAAIGAYREALQVTPSPTTRRRMQEVIARQAEADDLFEKLASGDRGPGEAIRLLTKVLEIRPEDARAHRELGTLYAMRGQRAEAAPHLEAVARYDPGNSSGVTRLAWMALVEGRFEEAAALCAQADRIDPGEPGNHYVWGTALAQQKRWADAEKQFRAALCANPIHRDANQGLSGALRQQGQAEEAVRFARRAVRLSDSKDPEALLTLADAYAAAQRMPEARATLEQALAAAEPSRPSLAAAIRKRLSELP
jgi:tetratricopeptide (TPR) repeat protein